MEHILKVTLFGTFAGITGTMLGGIISAFFTKSNARSFCFILEYAAGFMVAIVCFDLLPTAFVMTDVLRVILGLITGILFIILLQDKLKHDKKTKSSIKNKFLASGIMMIISIAAHNLPEGLAIGSGFQSSVGLGLSLMIVIMLHNIPEGLALSLPLIKGGKSIIIVILLSALAGAPTGIGAFLGALIGSISEDYIAMCLAVAGGAMLYVSIGDVVPESKRLYKGRFSSVGNILGIISGIIIAMVL